MYDFSSGNWPARNIGNFMSRIESLFLGLSRITNTKNIPASLAFLTALWTVYNDKESTKNIYDCFEMTVFEIVNVNTMALF